jgi:hypothetical protein
MLLVDVNPLVTGFVSGGCRFNVPWRTQDGGIRQMSEMLNLVGLSTGVVLYTMLLAMVVRSRRAGRWRPTIRCSWRPPSLDSSECLRAGDLRIAEAGH